MPDPAFIRTDRKLLFILSPGNMSRHWVRGMIIGAQKAGLAASWMELEQLRIRVAENPAQTVAGLPTDHFKA